MHRVRSSDTGSGSASKLWSWVTPVVPCPRHRNGADGLRQRPEGPPLGSITLCGQLDAHSAALGRHSSPPFQKAPSSPSGTEDDDVSSCNLGNAYVSSQPRIHPLPDWCSIFCNLLLVTLAKVDVEHWPCFLISDRVPYDLPYGMSHLPK